MTSNLVSTLRLIAATSLATPADHLMTAEPTAHPSPGAAPGGIVVVSSAGQLLGHLLTDKETANCAFGGSDGRSLFITAADTLLRIRTRVRGTVHQAPPSFSP